MLMEHIHKAKSEQQREANLQQQAVARRDKARAKKAKATGAAPAAAGKQ